MSERRALRGPLFVLAFDVNPDPGDQKPTRLDSPQR